MRQVLSRFIVPSLILVSLGLWASCSPATTPAPSDQKADPNSIGIVLPTASETRWNQDAARFSARLTAQGFTPQILFSEHDPTVEAANVDTLLGLGIKVLVLCPVNSAAAAGATIKAGAAGVKVIAYDRLVTQSAAVDRYITFDAFEIGQAMGQFLVDRATEKDLALYLYAGATSDNNAFLFFSGSWSVLQPKVADGTFLIQNSPQAVALKLVNALGRSQQEAILAEITTGWNPTTAATLATTNLGSPDVRLGEVSILAPNDQTSRAIAGVFRSLADVRGVTITGQDADKASIQAIIDGKQTMTVLKDVRSLVDRAVAEAVDLAKGRAPDTTKTYGNGLINVPAHPVPVVVVTKANVRSAIIDSGYYQASDFSGTY